MDQADFAAGGSRDVFESFSCLSSLFAAADFFFRLLPEKSVSSLRVLSLSFLFLSKWMVEQERGSPSVRPFGASQRSVAEILLLRVVEITG